MSKRFLEMDDGETYEPTTEEIAELLEDFNKNYPLNDIPTEPPPKPYLSYCWYCKEYTIDSRTAKKDSVDMFMYICPDCGHSLREWPGIIKQISARLGGSIKDPKSWYMQLLEIPKYPDNDDY